MSKIKHPKFTDLNSLLSYVQEEAVKRIEKKKKAELNGNIESG